MAECLPTCTGPGNPPKYPRETYWDYYHWRMSKTYTHYGKVSAEDVAAAYADLGIDTDKLDPTSI